METLRFLSPAQAHSVRSNYGTPAYVYSEAALRKSAEAALAFPNAFGLTVRFAMKASPNAAILRLFDSMGLHIDASSGFEVERALRAGIAAEKISLSAQQMPDDADFSRFHKAGIKFNACSLNQLRRFGQLFPGGTCGVRFNPGLGSGGTGKTNVGGPHSSFGIWHEWADQVEQIAADAHVTIERIHTHIGSGSDPEVWSRTTHLSLALVRRFTSATTLNLGGGYKVGRMAYEKTTDLQKIGTPVKEQFAQLAAETGRKIRLEIEPGTYLVANNGALVSTIQDIVETGGAEAMKFLKLDSGMTEILRPSLYAAQHPVVVLGSSGNTAAADAAKSFEADNAAPRNSATATTATETYMVVGHCCESGDVITVGPDDPESLSPRELARASVGDLCVIEGAGAYCSGMSAKNYNSFPEAPEVLLTEDGQLRLIRKRQNIEQILINELP